MLLKEEVVGHAEVCLTVKGNKKESEPSLNMATKSDTVTVEPDSHEVRDWRRAGCPIDWGLCFLPSGPQHS